MAVGLLSLYVWVWRLLRHHKTATATDCFLGLQRFPAPVTVWQRPFHTTRYIETTDYACGTMLNLLLNQRYVCAAKLLFLLLL